MTSVLQHRRQRTRLYRRNINCRPPVNHVDGCHFRGLLHGVWIHGQPETSSRRIVKWRYHSPAASALNGPLRSTLKWRINKRIQGKITSRFATVKPYLFNMVTNKMIYTYKSANVRTYLGHIYMNFSDYQNSYLLT